MEPIILWGNGPSPNPKKVAIVLEELGIPYDIKTIHYDDAKKEPFLTLNPNGRLPAIEDPNTGYKLFESGVIIEYLVAQYDKDAKLHYDTDAEKYLTQSWLHFQMSGQGPYFGQYSWFTHFHSEKVPSAIERYSNEIKRVTGVIDAHLKKQGTKYLVGDKLTYADLAFVPWFDLMTGMLLPDWDINADYPVFWAWLELLQDRPAVKAAKQHPSLQMRRK